jgi:hypothetical protein
LVHHSLMSEDSPGQHSSVKPLKVSEILKRAENT